MDKPGYHQGRHFTEYVEEVRALRRAGDETAAESLLLYLIGATEAESRADHLGVAPWYYQQVAIVRHKRGDIAGEVEILERFASQKHAPGASPPKLLTRLGKAKASLSR